jgi:hypothetical protein
VLFWIVYDAFPRFDLRVLAGGLAVSPGHYERIRTQWWRLLVFQKPTQSHQATSDCPDIRSSKDLQAIDSIRPRSRLETPGKMPVEGSEKQIFLMHILS